VNLSPALEGDDGVFTIRNPFGALAVSRIELRAALDPSLPPTHVNADYAFGSLTYAVIPEPGTFVLAGLGLLGLGAACRRAR
jgi:hypothetical protein